MPPLETGPQNTAQATPTESINPSTNPSEPTPKTPTVHATDGAGGVAKVENKGKNKGAAKRSWYVVFVAPRSEKKVHKELLDAGYEAYAATRTELHVWGRGQRRKVEQVLIHGVVFVKILETQLDEIRPFPFVYSYMMDPARKNNKDGFKTFAIIRDGEMRLLKAMLGQSEYEVDFATQFSLGDYVRIVGFDEYDELAQIVCIPNDKATYVGVRVGFLGCAYMKVPLARIVKLPSSK